MRGRDAVFAAALIMLPLGVQGADLVVWCEKGFYPQEDEAVRDIIEAFEQGPGKQVELVQYSQAELPDKIEAALEAGQPPDFVFGFDATFSSGRWAYEGRLVDLSDEILPFASLFDPDALAAATLFDATTGQRALKDTPKQWEAFWAFWCDQVQPAVRRATGRDDIWGVGLAMSAKANDTHIEFGQFIQAYQADYVTREGKLVIDDPEIRHRLIGAMDNYTAIWRKGCTPPDAVGWDSLGNNQAFLSRTVVMTPNGTLSIPNALKRERPEDYYENTATIEWPAGADGQPLAISTGFFAAAAFKARGHVALAKEFVHFLVAEGWLAHYLDFSAERFLPAMSKLLDQPFWLDPSDRHQMVAVMQAESRPLAHDYTSASGDLGHDQVFQERVWAQAIHRIATEGISPEQAVDEAITRIKQILAE
jgi:multiple sugar transport system substrate-binding protein